MQLKFNFLSIVLCALLLLMRSHSSEDNSSQIFSKAIQDLRGSEIMQRALREGDQAPAFKLFDQFGKIVELKDLLQEGPVVVSFIRGSWCTYCMQELQELSKIYAQIRELGASFVAISPEVGNGIQKMALHISSVYPILSDPDAKIAEKFGVVFRLPDNVNQIYLQNGIDLNRSNRTGSQQLPLTSTYIIGPTGKIHFAYLEADYKLRVNKQELLKSLRDLKGSRLTADSAKARLLIRGMSCASCSATITRRLLSASGVISAQVNHESGVAEVLYTPQLIDVDDLKKVVGKGFTVISAQRF